MIDMTNKYQEEDIVLARYAKALGHPARVAILRFLASNSSCFFGAIHDVLPISKATVSKHLSELKDAGLIQGEILPPKVKYCINRENWEYAQKILCQFMSDYKDGGDCCK